jgi:hypothetical protein
MTTMEPAERFRDAPAVARAATAAAVSGESGERGTRAATA